MSGMLAAFNNHIDELVDDLLRVMPRDPDILAAQAALAASRRMNVSALVRGWPEYTRPYYDRIEQGDIKFFLAKDYTNDVPTGSGVADPIDRIRTRTAALTADQQRKVMRYIKNLTTLADLYAKQSV